MCGGWKPYHLFQFRRYAGDMNYNGNVLKLKKKLSFLKFGFLINLIAHSIMKVAQSLLAMATILVALMAFIFIIIKDSMFAIIIFLLGYIAYNLK